MVEDCWSHTSDLPLSPVLSPQSDAILVGRDADPLMQLYKSSPELFPPFSNLRVRHPHIFVVPGFPGRIPRASTETPCAGTPGQHVLKKIVDGLNCRVKGIQELVLCMNVAIDRCSSFALRTRQRNCIGMSGRRRRRDLGDVCGSFPRRHLLYLSRELEIIKQESRECKKCVFCLGYMQCNSDIKRLLLGSATRMEKKNHQATLREYKIGGR